MRISMFKGVGAYFSDCSLKEMAERIKELKPKKEKFAYFVEHFDTLDDKEFFEYFDQFYFSIYEELITRCVFKNKKTKEAIITTNDMGSSIVTSGSKGDFDWWTECFLYEYRIACEVSFNIEPWKVYTLQELSELCKQRKVVVLDRRAGRGRGWVSSGEKTEADAQIKLNDFGSKEEMDALAFKVLRADITKKDVEKDYKKLCNAYENLCSRVKKKIEEAKKKIEDSQKELNYFTDVVKKTIEEKNDEMCK